MPAYKTANPRKKITSTTLGQYLKTCDLLEFKTWVKACMVLLWAYGIRIGELRRLRKEDLTLSDGYLIIESIPLKNPSDPFRDLPLKTNTPHLTILIKYWLMLPAGSKILPHSENTLRRRLKKIDPELSPHVFRHWRGTRLGFATENPYKIMGWMGHSDIRTAVKYQHMSGALADKLGREMEIK